MTGSKQTGKVDIIPFSCRVSYISLASLLASSWTTALVHCSHSHWRESKAINSLNPEHTRMANLYLEHKGRGKKKKKSLKE